jgi:hypothetical protein
MPKYQHSRGKRITRNSKRRVTQVAAVSTTTAGTAASQPVVKAPAPSPRPTSSKPASVAVASAPAYPYLMSDLKKIGIMAAIAIVVLLVLYFVLT